MFITWTQRSNQSIESGATPCALTLASPRAPPAWPTYPTPLAWLCASRLPTRPPVARPPAHSTPRRLPSRPYLLHPDQTTRAAHPTSCHCILHPMPPPLMSPSSCSASRRPATSEWPCLLCPAPLPSMPLPPPTLCLTKWLSKSQNGWANHKVTDCYIKIQRMAEQILRMTGESHEVTEEITKWLSKS
jgi:hypothetical protein